MTSRLINIIKLNHFEQVVKGFQNHSIKHMCVGGYVILLEYCCIALSRKQAKQHTFSFLFVQGAFIHS